MSVGGNRVGTTFISAQTLSLWREVGLVRKGTKLMGRKLGKLSMHISAQRSPMSDSACARLGWTSPRK